MAAQAVFGGKLAWWSDIEDGPIAVMQHHHPGIPNIGDLKDVDWSAVKPVDVLTAGYPCQPFSNAGKRKGTDDPRHIWPWIAYAVAVMRPRFLVFENVAAHVRRGFDVVAGDLAALGYDIAWSVVRASDVGAPHRRERLFIVASDATGVGWREGRPESAGQLGRPDVAERGSQTAADPYDGWGQLAPEVRGWRTNLHSGHRERGNPDWRQYTPAIRRWEAVLGVPAPRPDARGPRGGLKVSPAFAEWLMGVPGRITSVPGLSINERLKLAGNGVIPQQAEHAIRGLLRRLTCTA